MGLVIYLCLLCVSFSAPLPPVSAVTPLVAEQFAWELRFHPQRPQVDFVLDGIRDGFKLGFSPSQKLKSAKKDKPSATQHASVIDVYLASKLVVLVSFRKRANQANGVSLWICLPPGG